MSIDTEEEAERATVRVARSRDDDFVAFVESAGPYLYRTAYLLAGDATGRRTWCRPRSSAPTASGTPCGTASLGYARRVLVNLRIDTWRGVAGRRHGAWNDRAAVHVLDRRTGRERTPEPGAAGDVVTSIDVSGGDVVWSTAGDDGNTAYLVADALGDGRPQILDQGDGVASVAIAGDLVAWRVEAGDGTASLHRARFER
ncbi:hypothetical protein [Promicromonospora panici]|uniref:hypothetical protein n=1 Tax=Promicromonospora panici TaxID=2219658 RepID=UPI00101CA96F|nr:hypothetical protein [Promicromonospora panici]